MSEIILCFYFCTKEVEKQITEMILANIVGKVKVTYVTDPIVDTHLMSIFNLIIAEKLG